MILRQQLVDQRLTQVVERQQHDGDVVQRLVGDRVLHDLLDDVSADLVDGLVFALEVPLGCDPRLLDHFLVRDFVENSVAYQKVSRCWVLTTEQQEVHLVVDLKLLYVWRRDHYVWVAAVFLSFCLDVTESARDTQTAWEDTEWAVDYVWIRVSLVGLLAHERVVLAWLVGDRLDLLVVALGDRLRLVHFAARVKNPLLFMDIIWFVVKRKVDAKVSTVSAQNRSTVANIDDEYPLLDQKSNDGTGPTTVQHVRPSSCEVFYCVKKVVFCFLVAVDNCLPWVLWEKRVFDNELVKVVSQEVSAGVASMAVKHPEEAALGPVLNVLLAWRLHYVQNDTYPVFIVVSDYPLVGVCGITHNATVFTYAAFCWLPSR